MRSAAPFWSINARHLQEPHRLIDMKQDGMMPK